MALGFRESHCFQELDVVDMLIFHFKKFAQLLEL